MGISGPRPNPGGPPGPPGGWGGPWGPRPGSEGRPGSRGGCASPEEVQHIIAEIPTANPMQFTILIGRNIVFSSPSLQGIPDALWPLPRAAQAGNRLPRVLKRHRCRIIAVGRTIPIISRCLVLRGLSPSHPIHGSCFVGVATVVAERLTAVPRPSRVWRSEHERRPCFRQPRRTTPIVRLLPGGRSKKLSSNTAPVTPSISKLTWRANLFAAISIPACVELTTRSASGRCK